MNQITYFRPRKSGPELIVEDAVVNQSIDFFQNDNLLSWRAGSVPLGAGVPDLLFVSCNPEVLKLSKVNHSSYQILAYLKTTKFADLPSLINIFKASRQKISNQIDCLIDEEIILSTSQKFSLCPVWSEILPEIVAVEAKVNDWQKAVSQANRNRIFAHRSLIALPEKVAKRISKEPILNKLGIGLLSVDEDNQVTLLKRGRRSKPVVWNYYYKLAYIIANNS